MSQAINVAITNGQCNKLHLRTVGASSSVCPQASFVSSTSSSSLPGGGFAGSRTPSSESLFFHFDELFVRQSARNVELHERSMSVRSTAAAAAADKRGRRPSLARRLSRLFAPDKQQEIPGIHKSHSQPLFRPHHGHSHGRYPPRPLNSCSSAEESHRSSCSSEELSNDLSSRSSSSVFADVFGRFEPSRVPPAHPEEMECSVFRGKGSGNLFPFPENSGRVSRTLPRSLKQKHISRKKILDSLFEEQPDRPKFRIAPPEEEEEDEDADGRPSPENAVITPVHLRVRKPGMVMSLSRAKLVRSLLGGGGGCDDDDDGDVPVDVCDDVIDDEDMRDIFDSPDGGDDHVVPEVKGGCEEEEGEEDDIEKTRRKIEKKVLVIFDEDQLPTNKGVLSVRLSGFLREISPVKLQNRRQTMTKCGTTMLQRKRRMPGVS